MVYSYLNHEKGNDNFWDGWKNLWQLNVAPKVKHFIWLLFHDAVKTNDYLYRLNLGPQTLCTFCNLNTETVEHLFLNCYKTQEIWNITCSTVSKPINLSDGISSKLWLKQELTGNGRFIQSIIASTVWFIWKARCNKIFNNVQLDSYKVSCWATGHVREFSYAPSPHSGRNFILNNYTFADSPILLTATAFNANNSMDGLGFIASDYNANMLRSGCCWCPANSYLEAATKAICFSLQDVIIMGLHIKSILSPCADLVNAVKTDCCLDIWRLHPQIIIIKDCLLRRLILNWMSIR
ncbi:uncharacterized protein LOC120255437 [Dioscorea cayenensis subsp. rotundata]|uniref:Uncharacterized protein LOC120255437 n=1 Tax=Dioscorea cayennensis subsp. rotundata TaxID=55577 RepID=A0AB40AW41_DIOCR|nr:uncharacterized protein LOC120255437 [Dioscorea cayenensis subsp. rotundata]XP_039119194.1 uncharacterized protein LOC120255437 [Dioscorea cayenensis subsp. rotundata]XP_039119195.1 uncharacterized protein LOC120255437 [Dioscorea cayenensis subsp. rotundata]XP_039119196.1 uncharacterized protein LOC120255437 [Dioscorea cayenensis subsp. rotundata]